MGTWTKSSKNLTPKQYLQGWVEFYKLKFKVDGRVLIPRPETELLVDEVIAFVGSDPRYTKQSQNVKKGPTLTILDIGTGAGNIAISLAKNLPKVKIFASDISEEALDLARENAKLNKVQDRIFFLQSDLLSAFRHPRPDRGSINIDSRFPLGHELGAEWRGNDNLVIITNLPYIPRGRIPYLDPSVKDFEPWIALDGGQDGFDLYRKLFQQISQQPRRLQPRILIGEIDYTHGELAIIEAKKYFPKANVEVKTDLAQKQRILLIRF